MKVTIIKTKGKKEIITRHSLVLATGTGTWV